SLEALSRSASTWRGVGLSERAALLRRCLTHLGQASKGWVAAACQAKGASLTSSVAGEEWLGGPVTLARNLRMLAESLEAGATPPLPGVRERPDGQVVVQVYPDGLLDKVILSGVEAQIWLEPGASPSQGANYREEDRNRPSSVSLVLGAGNVASIGPMDALYKLFVDDETVLLKTNPVNDYLGPWWEKAMHPLVEANLLRVVHGGGREGAYLCQHDTVRSIHITGSDRTHDAIVWGAPDQQAERKASGTPLLDKPITSELGCVTPVLVVPGPWSDAELTYQARNIAGMLTQNASFNCNAAKVVLLPGDWDRRDAFVERLREQIRGIAPRKAYYTGAQERYASFVEAYPSCEVVGENGPDIVPWTLLPDVPATRGEHALTQEAFCGVLALVDLPAADAVSYLEQAIPFANDDIWGTLSCMMLVHPRTEKAHPEAVDRAIAQLRYGGVAINGWAGLCYGLVSPSWGAFPGHTLDDIVSGRGF
ncbi:MAG: aldehyde dehydrogenase family protein, partial [Myxococcota bacterium]|nr:aldehyde dehydrogenase family protein [Myxococcota bacterium]